MPTIGLKHNFPNILIDDVIVVWYESSNELAEVGRLVFNPSHDHITFSIPNLNSVAHIVKWYQSSNGSTLETLLDRWPIDASIFNEAVVERYQYQVDRGQSGTNPDWADPADEDIVIIDERLADATYDNIDVNMRSTGPRGNSEYTILDDGGIQLIEPEKFISGDWIFITLYKTVAQQTPTQVTTTEFRDVLEIAANHDFTTTHYDCLLFAAFATSLGVTTFPAWSLIPNNTRVSFNTHGGTQNYWKLQFAGGNTAYFQGQLVNKIYLAKGEEIRLFFKNSKCYVVYYQGNSKIRGSVWADMNANRPTNTGAYLLAHEDTGVKNRDDYPALYEFIESLPAGVAVALASWGSSVTYEGVTEYPNKSRFGIDTIAFTFRVPHLANLSRRFLKLSGTDATRVNDVAGGRQYDGVGNFSGTIAMNHGHSYSGGPNVPTIGNGAASASSQNHTFTITTGKAETTIDNYGEVPLIVL